MHLKRQNTNTSYGYTTYYKSSSSSTTTTSYLLWLIPFSIALLTLAKMFEPPLESSMQRMQANISEKMTSNLEQYWTKDTVSSKLLLKSKRLRVEQRTIRLEGHDDPVQDWLWVASPESINVLIYLKEEKKFALFNQTKYGYEGYSLAPIGGYIEPNETPLQAAEREILEEMNCKPEELIFLGSFRVDVNRGFGKIHQYLAMDCARVSNQLRSDDLEKQRLVLLSKNELRKALMTQQFKEVKWANVVSMSLIHMSQGKTAL